MPGIVEGLPGCLVLSRLFASENLYTVPVVPGIHILEGLAIEVPAMENLEPMLS